MSKVNPPVWEEYEEGTFIKEDEIGIGMFRASVQYGNCDPVDLLNFCAGPPQSPSPCNGVDLQLVCIPYMGCYQFELQGTLPAFFQIDYIIKWKDGDGDWMIYNPGDIVCGSDISGFVMIHFCDDACPPICLEAVCEGCDPFDPGTPSNIAYCNDGDVEEPQP